MVQMGEPCEVFGCKRMVYQDGKYISHKLKSLIKRNLVKCSDSAQTTNPVNEEGNFPSPREQMH